MRSKCFFSVRFVVEGGFKVPNLRGVQTTITFLILGIWTSSAVISLPLFYGYGTSDDIFEGATPNRTRSICRVSDWPVSAEKSWHSIHALVTYVLPFIVIVVAHIFIIRKLRKTREKLYAPTVTTASTTASAIATTTTSAAATTSTISTIRSVYVQQLEDENRIKDAKSANLDLKITKVLVSMTVWFVICWTPWTLGRILRPFICR